MEVLATISKKSLDTALHSYIASVGQRAVTEEDVMAMVENSIDLLKKGVSLTEKSIYWGVRQ
jgi:hypothetical protein